MNAIVSLLLALHAPRWRKRYGAEFAALLEDTGITPGIVLDALVSALDSRIANPRYRVAPQRLAARLVLGVLALQLALVVGGAPAFGQLAAQPPMREGRADATATALRDGTVLIAGGMLRNHVFLRSAELYDPVTHCVVPVGSMHHARVGQTATLLRDGRVLIAGGGYPVVDAAELYDPATRTFAETGRLAHARVGHTATLLTDGRVLIAGGARHDVPDDVSATAEIYDPRSGTFSPAGTMTAPRILHTATLLGDGRVLLTGGSDADERVTATAELYDPRTNAFRPTGTMHETRIKHDAILLRDGRVFVAGGAGDYGWSAQRRSTELYDPRTGAFANGPAMDEPRFKIRSSLAMLADGTVAIAAGGKHLDLFDPKTGTIQPDGAFEDAYHYAAVTAMASGDLLIAGGYTTNDHASDRIWVYRPHPSAR